MTADDPKTGISIRYAKDFVITPDTDPARIDAWACPHCGTIIWTSNYIGHMLAHRAELNTNETHD